MKAYSLDLRERVVRAVDAGHSHTEITAILKVSPATIKRYVKRRKETGGLAPKGIPGRPPKQCDAVVACILSQLQAHDDASLVEHCRLLEEEQGITGSPRALGRAIRKLGWTRKKRRCLR
jgi:transposase